MSNLTLLEKEQTITSLEVAEMVGKMKNIYVLENEFGNVKIGVSCNVKERVKTLSMQGGFKITRLFFTEPCSNSYKLENKCHKHFSKNRISGEWFDIDFLEVKRYVNELFSKRAKNIPKHIKSISPEEIECAFGNNQKDFPLTEFTKAVGHAMDEIGISDLQKLLVYKRIFEKAGIPTSCLDIAEKEIIEREKGRKHE